MMKNSRELRVELEESVGVCDVESLEKWKIFLSKILQEMNFFRSSTLLQSFPSNDNERVFRGEN